jgi:hypothetical protein
VPAEHDRRGGQSVLVRADDGDRRFAGDTECGDDPLAALERCRAEGGCRHARPRQGRGTHEHRGALLRRVRFPADDRQGHGRRLEAKTRRHARRRAQLAGRGARGEHDAHIDEIDHAVRVPVLEDNARLEEIG